MCYKYNFDNKMLFFKTNNLITMFNIVKLPSGIKINPVKRFAANDQ